MPFASLACGSLLCVFCPGAHRHRAGIKTTVPNAEEIRIAHNLAYSQAGLVTSIRWRGASPFWGTDPLAYRLGSLNRAKSTRLLPSRDRQGRFPSGIPKRVSTLDGGDARSGFRSLRQKYLRPDFNQLPLLPTTSRIALCHREIRKGAALTRGRPDGKALHSVSSSAAGF